MHDHGHEHGHEHAHGHPHTHADSYALSETNNMILTGASMAHAPSRNPHGVAAPAVDPHQSLRSDMGASPASGAQLAAEASNFNMMAGARNGIGDANTEALPRKKRRQYKTEEERRNARIIKNRRTAEESRQRRLRRMHELEESAKLNAERVRQLEHEVMALKAELANLKAGRVAADGSGGDEGRQKVAADAHAYASDIGQFVPSLDNAGPSAPVAGMDASPDET
jgi:hypothetical protein